MGQRAPMYNQKCIFTFLLTAMFNLVQIEQIIKQSDWWKIAAVTVDNHHSNNSGIMLTDHLQQVYCNIETIFQQPGAGFYGELFNLLAHLNVDKKELKDELKVVALLHDIGKPVEDKMLVMPHPLTGKPAHKRHGLAGLMAAMEILAPCLDEMPEKRDRIYRTIELHDMSYGLFREYQATLVIPPHDRWTYINHKIHVLPAAGIIYLLIFKLADVHGHANISDVIWFYHAVKSNYFNQLLIDLPIPTEADIR
jgi:hypothetical protein